MLRAAVHICRSGWHLSVWGLGWASGYQQPERHWSSWEICSVLFGLVCHTDLSWRLPSSDERLHWQVKQFIWRLYKWKTKSINNKCANDYLWSCVQEGRVSSRALGRLDCPHFPPKRRATWRVLVTSLASATSPPATSPRRAIHQAVAAAAATSLTVTWLSWSTHDGLTPGLSGSTLCLGVLDVCSILLRWLKVYCRERLSKSVLYWFW